MNNMLVPYRRYADFSGRSRRSEFWMFALLQVLVGVAFIVLLAATGGALFLASGDAGQLAAAGGMLLILVLLFAVYWLATIIPYYAVTVRRLHDTNRTGWWAFGPLVLSLVTNVMAVGAAAAGDPVTLTLVVGLFSVVNMGLSLVVLVFLCLDGTPGPNQYGQDPKFRGYEHTFA